MSFLSSKKQPSSLNKDVSSFPLAKDAGTSVAPRRLQWKEDDKLAPLGKFWSDAKDCYEYEWLTYRQAFEGVCVFGGTGSGKSSGSGQTLAKSFLRKGFGGCVLTAKISERGEWKKYAEETGRSNDILVIDSSPSSPTINLLEYEHSQMGASDSFSLELANILLDATASNSKQGGENAAFWEFSTRQLLFHALVFLTLSKTPLSLDKLVRLIRSAPSVPGMKEYTGFFAEVLKRLIEEKKQGHFSSDDQLGDYLGSLSYWTVDFPGMDPKTRSNVVMVLVSQLSSLLASPFLRIFSSKTTITPQASYEQGKIIIVDFPIKKFGAVGKLAQILFKQIWQRALERRADKSMPVFLWMDEAQYFVSPSDLPFLQTARSSKVSTVFLSQSVANYRVALGDHSGGQGGETDGLLGNFQTQIFHANGCPITNGYAERVFGQVKKKLRSSQANFGSFNTSSGSSESYLPLLPANKFTSLKKGSKMNGNIVEAYVFQAGRKWKNGKGYFKCSFDQNFKG